MTFAVAFSTVMPHMKITERSEHRSEDELTKISTSFEYTSSFGEAENDLIPQLPDYSNLNSKYQFHVKIINILKSLSSIKVTSMIKCANAQFSS